MPEIKITVPGVAARSEATPAEPVCAYVFNNGVSICNAVERIHGDNLGMVTGHTFQPTPRHTNSSEELT